MRGLAESSSAAAAGKEQSAKIAGRWIRGPRKHSDRRMPIMVRHQNLILCSLLCALAVVSAGAAGPQGAGVKKSMFGKMADGREIALYTLTNRRGMKVEVTNYGARTVSIVVPDRDGKMADVLLGFDSGNGYLGDNPFFGAIVGRCANRIAQGEFKLDGKAYHLPINNGPNTLHGGPQGFDKRLWTGREISQNPPAVEMAYLSKNGEEGFPGNLYVKVVYTLENDNALRIDYSAATDQDTVINLSNHSYFNLHGQGNGDILGTLLTINADQFTPIGPKLIPTGRRENVAGTPLDFRKPTVIGARIGDDNAQLKYAGGYDFNYVLNRQGSGLQLAARAVDPESGRVLEVLTTQPGLQFYTGNFLDGTIHGEDGKAYVKHAAFCLETQHFPDSPNQPNFPSTELKPGQTFHQVTVFKFSVEK
jgi:aldose 1-epimerase